MGKISTKLRAFAAILFLGGLIITYQNCGPMSGTSPFDITLGSNGGGGPIINSGQVKNKLALGYEHSCGISSTGGVKCWGAGSQGQLGYGALVAYSFTPVTVIDLPASVSKISAGSSFTCALLTTGVVYCWGDDTYGQLGNGLQSTNSPFPVAASAETNLVYDIATSSSTTCVVLNTGVVQCWGLNASGEFGNGSQANSVSAVSVAGISNAVAISAGNGHFCATLSTGGVMCWGMNSSGQDGNQTSSAAQVTPVAVTGITTAQKAVAGGANTCAILAGGTVSCWGDNTYGELGDGNTTQTLSIMPVINISGVSDLSLGSWSACALIGSSIKCWGYNAQGQLGDSNFTSTSVPTSVSNITTAVAIGSGSYHRCAFLSSGGVDCWGWNDFGQLGNGSTVNSSVPVAVNGGAAL